MTKKDHEPKKKRKTTMTEPEGGGLPHSADEAGGEAVFTSDGLPALIAPLPPPPLNNDGRRHDDDDNNDNGDIHSKEVDDSAFVIQEELDPRMAFQAFSRHPPANAGSWNLDTITTDDDDDDDAADIMGGKKVDPYYRRLRRLKADIQKLETELNTNTINEEDDDTYLKTMMIELKSRIDALGMTSSIAKRQEQLSRIIIEKASDRGTLLLGGDENEKKIKVVYDLYRQEEQKKQLSPLPRQREALFEERLRRLENVIGYATTTGDNNANKSILERIEEAEHLTRETIDGKQLEKFAAKAKVIRADLEAAARAKTKLASSSSGSTTTAEEDSQVISALHAQLIELDGMSTHLPALTLRLLELSNLHTHAAEFASRLTDAEFAVGRSERMLINVEEALTKMEDGWIQNRNVLERNVKRLDEMLTLLPAGRGKEVAEAEE